MKRELFSATICFVMLLTISGQSWQQRRDSINRVSYKDHQLMLQMLGIKELRPGPSGNPEAPDAANTDESKASPYTSLPDPLKFNNGEIVKNIRDWEVRREEIMEEFDREIYGRVPDNVPGVSWEVISTKDTVIGGVLAREQQLAGHVDNSSYPETAVKIALTLTTPVAAKEAVPVIMEFGWNFSFGRRPGQSDGPTWQEMVLQKGWGYAILVPTSFQDDNGAGLRNGIIGLVNKGQQRKADDWGTLRAWAWGASRAIDYFESIAEVDASRVCIEGLSRYGKAAIVAMAYDQRIAIGLIGSSGAGGAKILRRQFGEQVENLASSAEYHWFTPNFIKYAGPLTPNDLSVDAHQLVALCAPRPIYISSGSPNVEGNWIDAKGMFLAGVHAGPVYKLLGKNDLGTTIYPGEEVGLTDGEIAFRQHAGGHTVGPNWPSFLEYAERYFK